MTFLFAISHASLLLWIAIPGDKFKSPTLGGNIIENICIT